uniref:Uncharacterized protein n=1 Tax=Meleagris gallopavo TaxID=9103 RepID=A0A803YI71_MELGA
KVERYTLGYATKVAPELSHEHLELFSSLPEVTQLIYDSFAQYLVTEKGYDKDLLTLNPESLDFCCKGLALDFEDGNFLKLAEDGTVLRASHGTRNMTSEEILEIYGRREWKHFSTVSGMLSRSGSYTSECPGL